MAQLIMRVYRVPGNMQEATDRLREALVLGVERDLHEKDIIREADDRNAKWHTVDLKPPTGWLGILVEQLTGNKKR